MMIHLYGSTTSPYVRRLRILLHGQVYEMHTQSIFEAKDRPEIFRNNPAGKVPYIVDDERGETLWDSRVIAFYLNEKLNLRLRMDYEVQKNLALVDEANDAAILLFQFRKFQVDPEFQSDIASRFLSRIERVVDYFEENTPSPHAPLDLNAIWFFSMMDWMMFRQVVPFKAGLENIQNFLKSYQEHPAVKATDPRAV